jgi:hypothetical protein
MRLPFRNATVTAVNAHGLMDDWDDTATIGSVAWSGVCDAYLTDTRQNEYTDGRSTTVVTRSVVVPKSLPVSVGDTLTIGWRSQTLTAKVQAVLRREPPPGAGLAGTTLLEIELG